MSQTLNIQPDTVGTLRIYATFADSIRSYLEGPRLSKSDREAAIRLAVTLRDELNDNAVRLSGRQ
jgi:hypothetical protein